MLTEHRPLLRALNAISLLLLVAVAGLVLAACSSPPAPPPVTVRTSTPAPAPTVTATPTPVATPTVARVVAPPKPPETGKWIDVDVTTYVVRLMDGKQMLKQLGPVAVGAEVNTGSYTSTQTGLFHVYNKIAPLSFDAPFNTYIQWWVGFDPAKDNGFHSFLKDAQGNVVDDRTGRVSNGCIRVGDAEAVYQFAEVGMPVFVRA